MELSEVAAPRLHLSGCTPGWASRVWEDALPDLTDAATVGCLLALVREAHGNRTLYARQLMGGPAWVVEEPLFHTVSRGLTEPAALVTALEAAHQRAASARREEKS
jgi:hypothetical protein